MPEVYHTIGTLQWVVALPSGFELQLIAGGLELDRSGTEMTMLGEYGRLIKSQPHLNLTKDLAPPTPISLQLKYRQSVPGFSEQDSLSEAVSVEVD